MHLHWNIALSYYWIFKGNFPITLFITDEILPNTSWEIHYKLLTFWKSNLLFMAYITLHCQNTATFELYLCIYCMYFKDRLACQVAEGVSLKMRKGKILNSKADWDAPSLIVLERNIHRGLWLLWPAAIINFLSSFHPNFHTFPFLIICSFKSKSKLFQLCLKRPRVRNMSQL